MTTGGFTAIGVDTATAAVRGRPALRAAGGVLIAISMLLPSASYLLFLQPTRPAPPAPPAAAAPARAAAPKPEAAPAVSAVESLPKEEAAHAPSAPAQSVATRPPPRREREGAPKVAKGALSPTAAPRGEAGERAERATPSANPSDTNGASAPPSASTRVRVLLEESPRAKVLE
jgi:hypothetical protein